jgi:hypothetical protein
LHKFLIEYDKGSVWDKDSLMRIAKQHKPFNIQHVPIEDTWLMPGNRVLMTRVNVIREGKFHKLEMTISETSIKDDTQRPWYIGMDR